MVPFIIYLFIYLFIYFCQATLQTQCWLTIWRNIQPNPCLKLTLLSLLFFLWPLCFLLERVPPHSCRVASWWQVNSKVNGIIASTTFNITVKWNCARQWAILFTYIIFYILIFLKSWQGRYYSPISQMRKLRLTEFEFCQVHW